MSLNFIIAMISHFQHSVEGREKFDSEGVLAGSVHFAELNYSPLSKRLSF